MDTIHYPLFHPQSRSDWRNWLTENHTREKSVWIIVSHKNSKNRKITYEEVVEEALCFGWIDGKIQKRDAENFFLYIARRREKSVWSESNKNRVEKLRAMGLMQPAGLKAVSVAKKNGSWNSIQEIEWLIIPPDLEELFRNDFRVKEYFNSLPVSKKKILLGSIYSAKRPETRQKRLQNIIALSRMR